MIKDLSEGQGDGVEEGSTTLLLVCLFFTRIFFLFLFFFKNFVVVCFYKRSRLMQIQSNQQPCGKDLIQEKVLLC